MKPEAKQVLTRVHNQLAQSSHPLPLLEPVQLDGHTQQVQFIPSLSHSAKLTKPRQRWLSRLNTLVAVLFVGLLIGSLAFTFSTISRTRVGSPSATIGLTNEIHVLLVPAESGKVPSQAQMEAVRTLLSHRFISFGLQGSRVRVLTANGQPAIQVELPHFGGNEQRTINTLLETGMLAFWDTGPSNMVAQGTLFHPNQFIQYNPGGKPRFTNQNVDPNSIEVFSGATNPLCTSFDPAEMIYLLRNMLSKKLIPSPSAESSHTTEGQNS